MKLQEDVTVGEKRMNETIHQETDVLRRDGAESLTKFGISDL